MTQSAARLGSPLHHAALLAGVAFVCAGHAHAQWSPVLRTTTQAATTGKPVGVVAVDVNGDGRADPVLATTAKELVTLLANPDLTFGRESKTLSDTPSSITAGDMNALASGSGGLPDLLIGSASTVATILLNQPGLSGASRWQTPSGTSSSWSTNEKASTVAIVDFEDGQTNPSLMGSSRSTKTSTSRTGDGSGGFPGIDTVNAASGTPEQMAFADMNADAKRDMILLSPDAGLITIYPFARTLCCPNPNGSELPPGGVEWGTPTTIPLIPGWSRVLAVADVEDSTAAEILVSMPSPVGANGGPSVSVYGSGEPFPTRGFTPFRSTSTEDVAKIVAFNSSTTSSGAPDVLAIATSAINARYIRSLGTLGAAESFQGTAVDMSNDGNVVVGTAGTTSWHWRAPYTRTTLPVPSGYTKTIATRVSGDGNVVVGEVQTAAGAKRAFRWTLSGGMVVLPEVAGYEGVAMSASGVSNNGSVVGGSLEQDPRSGFIWTSADGSRRLPDIMAAAGVADTVYPSVVRDVSPDGTIVVCTDSAGGDATFGDNRVVRLPGSAGGPSVVAIAAPSLNIGFGGTVTPYGVRRISGDGLKVLGSFYADVLTQPPQLRRRWEIVSSASAANPIDPIIVSQGIFRDGGFGDRYYTGARLIDVGSTPEVWCGFYGPEYFGDTTKPYPTPVASSFALSNWAAISNDGAILAGTVTGVVGGVSGTWPVRQINSAIVPLNITNNSATVNGISQNGVYAVGLTTTSAGTVAIRKSLNGVVNTLGDLAGGNNYAIARATNALGDVVVGQSSSWRGSEAFRWTPEKGMVGLGALSGGSFFSFANAVSLDGGTVVGYSGAKRGIEAFKWTSAKGMVGLGYLNGLSPYSTAWGVSSDGSTIIGASRPTTNTAHRHAFRKVGDNPMESLGVLDATHNFSEAIAVTPDGSVIAGDSTRANGDNVAFRWTSATGMVDIGGLPNGSDAMNTTPFAISPGGDIIVGQGLTPSGWRAFIWAAPIGFQDLNTFLPSRGVDLTGWTLTNAIGISLHGDYIVGEGVNSVGLTDGFILRWTPQGDGNSISFFNRVGGAFPDRFDSALTLPNGTTLVDMTAADVDGDGRRELVAVMTDGKVHIIGLTPSCPPDFNRDASVDFADIEAFVDAFEQGLLTADQNRDGFIDFEDFDQFVATFLDGCP
ncbi:MAG: GC-type dockerin domain-anchored protein [Planctomycetota bacterium]|nr:GC-type dockerin domain-anchored protein [Planctomycetota bacterium]